MAKTGVQAAFTLLKNDLYTDHNEFTRRVRRGTAMKKKDIDYEVSLEGGSVFTKNKSVLWHSELFAC